MVKMFGWKNTGRFLSGCLDYLRCYDRMDVDEKISFGGFPVELFKVLCLFLALWFGFVNCALVFHKNRVPVVNVVIWAVTTTGFIYFQWLAH